MPPLVFMHIPRAGGTGIDAWLYASFLPRSFWYPSDYIRQRFVGLPAGADAVVGHVPSTLPGTYITLLRPPVERVISLYYAHMNYGDFPHRGLSLHEYVERAPYAEIDNGMTRRL